MYFEYFWFDLLYSTLTFSINTLLTFWVQRSRNSNWKMFDTIKDTNLLSETVGHGLYLISGTERMQPEGSAVGRIIQYYKCLWCKKLLNKKQWNKKAQHTIWLYWARAQQIYTRLGHWLLNMSYASHFIDYSVVTMRSNVSRADPNNEVVPSCFVSSEVWFLPNQSNYTENVMKFVFAARKQVLIWHGYECTPSAQTENMLHFTFLHPPFKHKQRNCSHAEAMLGTRCQNAGIISPIWHPAETAMRDVNVKDFPSRRSVCYLPWRTEVTSPGH